MNTFSDISDIGELMKEVRDGARDGYGSTRGAVMELLACRIEDGANSLSQGQKQLLCVARVLLGEFMFCPRTTYRSIQIIKIIRKAQVRIFG